MDVGSGIRTIVLVRHGPIAGELRDDGMALWLGMTPDGFDPADLARAASWLHATTQDALMAGMAGAQAAAGCVLLHAWWMPWPASAS